MVWRWCWLGLMVCWEIVRSVRAGWAGFCHKRGLGPGCMCWLSLLLPWGLAGLAGLADRSAFACRLAQCRACGVNGVGGRSRGLKADAGLAWLRLLHLSTVTVRGQEQLHGCWA